MKNDSFEILLRVITQFMPYLFALCFHEFAHGWMAKLKGDRTAEMMGRLTMNPLAHADPIGTFLLPIINIIYPTPFMFGWAKPVPVNERNLKNPRKDMFWIALAGPASNFLLAFIAAISIAASIRLFATTEFLPSIMKFLSQFIAINLALAIFNSLPIHPLDGGKILARFLPARWNYQLEQWESYSSIILLILFVTPIARGILIYPLEFFYGILMKVATFGVT